MKLSRLYTTEADAAATLAALKAEGFRDGDCEIVKAGPNNWISKETLMGKEVSKAHAETYAEALRGGKILVLVNPILGYAQRAKKILGHPRGTENAIAIIGEEGTVWDESTPISSALYLPVLSKDPTPFGSFWNVPTVMKKYWFFSNLFGGHLLSSNPAPLSSKTGLKTLIDNPAPLSSLLKMPTLTSSNKS